MRRDAEMMLKFLELLSEGAVLSLVRDQRARRRLHEHSDEVWHSIDRKQLYQLLRRFHANEMIESIRRNEEQEVSRLTKTGAARIHELRMYTLSIPQKPKWDGMWRMVMFDIPEERRKHRDMLRERLISLGFVEFQQSVFVYPYPCRSEINYIINVLRIPEQVYYIEAPIEPDDTLRMQFGL